MAGQSTNPLTDAQETLLKELLRIGWQLSGAAADEQNSHIDEGFRQIFIASEAIDDLQDTIHPVETAELNSRMNDALDALTSGLSKLPHNCLRHALEGVRNANRGQKQDVSTTITQSLTSHGAVFEHCRKVSSEKTGSLIQLAFTLPWLSRNEEADSPPDAIADLGQAAGVAIQALNDWKDLRSETDSEDVFHGRVTWIWEWLFAERDGEEFDQLRSTAGACIRNLEQAREFRFRLNDEVNHLGYLQRARDRFRSALDTISLGNTAKFAAELEAAIFDRVQRQLSDRKTPPGAT